MRRSHLEAFRPLCPVCRGRGHDAPLVLARVLREETDVVLEGILHCPNAACQREYPIIDGVPIIVGPLRKYISDNLLALVQRTDLSGTLESLLGDCCGPGSTYDALRGNVGNYAWDHYADLAPDATAGAASSVVSVLEAGLDCAPGPLEGPCLDIGCGAGRTTFELAARTTGPVLGVDLSFAMIRIAAAVLHEGVARFDRRRVGVTFDRLRFPVTLPASERVDFWACDASALPLSAAQLGAAISLNVLDCLAAPYEHLTEIQRLLRPGGVAVIGTPYDWSPSATPFEAWLGGHSQRGAGDGASEPLLRALLSGGAHPRALRGLTLVGERDAVPWRVRMHDRGLLEYQVHLLAVRAEAPTPP